jgi:Polysaccharide biosynthesis enzyme WcbI
MSRKLRAVVISNCQCLPLAYTLSRLSADTIFEPWGVHILPSDKRAQLIEEFIEAGKVKYDFVLSIPLEDEFKELSSSRIQSSFGPPVVSISNIYFTGFHPDLTYIGGFANRVLGPLGDYHSKIALYAFINNLPMLEALDLYCNTSYSLAGYYDEFSSSFGELKRRDAEVDVPVSKLLEKIISERLCFLSVNHPSLALFLAYADQIAATLAERNLIVRSNMPAQVGYFRESLADNVIFPIYPEFAARHGLPEWGSYSFKPEGVNVNPISLREYVEGEYAVFSKLGPDALMRSHHGLQVANQLQRLRS